MTFLITVAAGVLVVALAHLVAGWGLSSGLHRGALLVQPRVKELAVRVRGTSQTRITLEAPAPRQDIGHPGVLGLVWDGGHARLGDVVSVEGMQVTRLYEPLVGTPPICVGDLEDCPPVEIDPWVFPAGPGDAGLDHELVSYQSPLGPMSAWLVPGGTGDRWAILCHGWTADKRELVRMLPSFHRAGYTTMVIDYRNDTEAPADPSGRYRFGLSEWEDLEGAVRWALDYGAGSVVVGGCSTGGALAMAFLEMSPLAGRIAGVYLDAPNIALAETVRHGTRERRITPLMFEVGLWIADLRWGIDWDATNFVERAGATLTVPTLVFHGTSDLVVPISVSRRLAAVAPDVVQLVETPAAGHVMSWNAGPKRYEGILEEFLGRL